MKQEYIELVNKFKDLSKTEKQIEIISNINELLRLMYIMNKSLNQSNEVLPIIKNYSNELESYDVLFTKVISLKEEIAKLINFSNYD